MKVLTVILNITMLKTPLHGLGQNVSTFRSRTEYSKFRIIYHYLHFQVMPANQTSIQANILAVFSLIKVFRLCKIMIVLIRKSTSI